jgi:hypothetical protein
MRRRRYSFDVGRFQGRNAPPSEATTPTLMRLMREKQISVVDGEYARTEGDWLVGFGASAEGAEFFLAREEAAKAKAIESAAPPMRRQIEPGSFAARAAEGIDAVMTAKATMSPAELQPVMWSMEEAILRGIRSPQ